MSGFSRRRFIQGSAGAIAVSQLTALGDAAHAAAGGASGNGAAHGPIIGVDLSAHPVPFPDNLLEVAELDQDYLDSLARRYWEEYARHLGRPLNEYDKADFWFRYIAIPLQEKALQGRSLGTGDERIEKDLGLIHMVGYLGGIWFGKKLDEFLGMETTSKCDDPDPAPTDEDFEDMVELLRNAIAAAREGTDEEAIELAEEAIRGGDIAHFFTNGLPTLNGAIGGYSYNVGYCYAILIPDNRAVPPPANPEGPSPWDPPWNSFLWTSTGIFDSTYPVWADPATAESLEPEPPGNPDPFEPVPYLIGDTAGMAIARRWLEDAKASDPDEYDRIVQGNFDRDGNPVTRGHLEVLAQSSYNTGFAFWTAVPTLNLRTWDDPSYHLIVSLSLFFLQAVQAAGAALTAAATTGDGPQARDALATLAVTLPFGASYLVSLSGGDTEGFACYTADESVPPFVFAEVEATPEASGPADSDARAQTDVRSAGATAPVRLPATGGDSLTPTALVLGAAGAAGLGLVRRRRAVTSAGPDTDTDPDGESDGGLL